MTDTPHETAALTADVVLFSRDETGAPHVLLIKRGSAPYEGQWALPGGHLDPGEDAEAAARRELEEEAGLDAGTLDYVDAYHAVGRDPRGRYVTFAFVGVVDEPFQPTAADDAAEAAWFPLKAVLDGGSPLAFDHRAIIIDARDLAVPFDWRA